MRQLRLFFTMLFPLAVMAIVGPAPAFGLSAPQTLVREASFGDLAGRAPVVRAAFAIEYLGVSWTRGAPPQMRFLNNGRWSGWETAHEDGHPAGGRRFSALASGGVADAFQVRGRAEDVEAVAINTTDGRRTRTVTAAAPAASAELAQPAVVTREQWGADESLRFNADGSEKWAPAFYPTQKLVVHHTATKNDDPDPAATVRAIYRYHAIDKGWGDIGYNFLVDGQGRVYKGRWSGPSGATTGDTSTGEDANGNGVTAAHVSGYNSGTVGVAVLGDYEKAQLPSAARSTVVDHLAWEAQRHGLDPESTSPYVNPVNGATKDIANISGHKDWGSTLCPGRNLYSQLDSIRADVAAAIAADGSSGEEPAPTTETTSHPSSVQILDGSTGESALTGFTADEDGDRYDLSSVKQGRKAVTQWNAVVPVGSKDGMLSLEVVLDARYSSSAAQTLAVYDTVAAKWVDVATATVGTGDFAVTWSTTSPLPYVNADGNVLLQVRSSSRKTHTASFDLLSTTVAR